MYRRYTQDFKLNNLIWVWNSPDPQWYVGDEYCDIASIDIYNPTNNYGPSKGQFDELVDIVKGKKPVALAENYPIPDPEALIESKTYWLYYATWSCDDEEALLHQNPSEHYKEVYEHPYMITLKDLPDLYS
jgi:mannan endo-1,4-beta-mannosidase